MQVRNPSSYMHHKMELFYINMEGYRRLADSPNTTNASN